MSRFSYDKTVICRGDITPCNNIEFMHWIMGIHEMVLCE
jgi:hypothetical protein